jgi:hypothetical protein
LGRLWTRSKEELANRCEGSDNNRDGDHAEWCARAGDESGASRGWGREAEAQDGASERAAR